MKGLFDIFYDFELIKDKLFIQAIGIERNKELLKHIPYMAVEDIAITYRVLASYSDESIASFLVTNEIMKMYGVTKRQLHQAAMQNAPEIMKAQFSTMKDILSEYIKDVCLNKHGDIGLPDELDYSQIFMMGDEGIPEMYILTNRRRTFGASVMFYPGLMKRVAAEIGGNFYILPCSVHEVILLKVPAMGEMPLRELYEMVQFVNDNRYMMQEKDILSYSVYWYDIAEDRIKIADRDAAGLIDSREVV